MSDETLQGVPEDEIETGERVAKSELTGNYYLVTMWQDLGDGKLKALKKKPLPDDWEPPEEE